MTHTAACVPQIMQLLNDKNWNLMDSNSLWGMIYLYLIQAWIINCIPTNKARVEISCICPKFNGANVEVFEWIVYYSYMLGLKLVHVRRTGPSIYVIIVVVDVLAPSRHQTISTQHDDSKNIEFINTFKVPKLLPLCTFLLSTRIDMLSVQVLIACCL